MARHGASHPISRLVAAAALGAICPPAATVEMHEELLEMTWPCSGWSFEQSATWVLLSETHNGSPVWIAPAGMGRSESLYLYHDLDCDCRGPNARAGWFMSLNKPDTKRMQDLDVDGVCYGSAATASDDASMPPMGSTQWMVYCCEPLAPSCYPTQRYVTLTAIGSPVTPPSSLTQAFPAPALDLPEYGGVCPTPSPAPTAASVWPAPTAAPSAQPMAAPTSLTTAPPSAPPTPAPTPAPTPPPPTPLPTAAPTSSPTRSPTGAPSRAPTGAPTGAPTAVPTTAVPTTAPTASPTTAAPTAVPTPAPTAPATLTSASWTSTSTASTVTGTTASVTSGTTTVVSFTATITATGTSTATTLSSTGTTDSLTASETSTASTSTSASTAATAVALGGVGLHGFSGSGGSHPLSTFGNISCGSLQEMTPGETLLRGLTLETVADGDSLILFDYMNWEVVVVKSSENRTGTGGGVVFDVELTAPLSGGLFGATSSVTVCVATQASCTMGCSILTEDALPGNTSVSVVFNSAFSAGDLVTVTWGSSSETATVVDFGSIVFDSPLNGSYPRVESYVQIVFLGQSLPGGLPVNAEEGVESTSAGTETVVLVSLAVCSFCIFLAGGVVIGRKTFFKTRKERPKDDADVDAEARSAEDTGFVRHVAEEDEAHCEVDLKVADEVDPSAAEAVAVELVLAEATSIELMDEQDGQMDVLQDIAESPMPVPVYDWIEPVGKLTGGIIEGRFDSGLVMRALEAPEMEQATWDCSGLVIPMSPVHAGAPHRSEAARAPKLPKLDLRQVAAESALEAAAESALEAALKATLEAEQESERETAPEPAQEATPEAAPRLPKAASGSCSPSWQEEGAPSPDLEALVDEPSRLQTSSWTLGQD